MADRDPSEPKPLPRTRSTVWWVFALVVAAGAAGLFWRSEHKFAPAEHNTVELTRSVG